MQKKLALFSTMLSLWLLSCVGPLTEVWVVVESNIPVSLASGMMGLEKIHVTASVRGAPFWDQEYSLATGTYALPGHFVIRPRGADETRPVELVVEGVFRDTNIKVSQRAIFTFARGRRLLLRVYLASECVGRRQMECEAMGLVCGEGGGCISPERMNLPDYGSDGSVNGTDATVSDAPTNAMLLAPRLTRPLSGSVMSSRKPTIKWSLPMGVTGARVEFYSDRACTRPISAHEVPAGNTFTPTSDLPSGTVFFRLRGFAAGAFSEGTSPVWQMRLPRTVPNPAVIDSVIRTDADFDGDGFADIAYDSTEMMGGPRQLRLLFGGPDRMAMLQSATPIATTASPELVGDVNGDGFVDFATKTASGVRVFFGNANRAMILAMSQPIAAAMGSSGFGDAIAAGGDFDQDGYGDILIGAPQTQGNSGGMAVMSAGAAYYVRGAPSLGAAVSITTGTTRLEQLGTAFSAGDMNGDELTEVVFSAPFFGANAAGAAQAINWPMGANMFAAFTGLLLSPASLNAHMGRMLALTGDNNGDGRADLLVNANEYQNAVGAVGWKAGAGGMPTSAVPLLRLGTMTQPIGTTIAQLGDLNGDGLDELAFSRREAPMMAPSEVLVYQGVMAGNPTLVAPTFITGTLGMTTVGAVIAGVGDVDGDGYADMICPIATPSAVPSNSLVIYWGGAFPLSSRPVANGTIYGVAAAN